MIVPFEENEEVYSHAFQQGGSGMPRYRGSPMIGGNFFGRILSFARWLFSKAAPHTSSIISQAQPYVKKAAAQALDSAIDAVTHVTEKLKKKQEGSGKKRKRLKKPILKSSKL